MCASIRSKLDPLMSEFSLLFELNPVRPDSDNHKSNGKNIKYTRISAWRMVIRNCGVLFQSSTVSCKVLLALAVVKLTFSNIDESSSRIWVARAGI
jgi:hypothetical protein